MVVLGSTFLAEIYSPNQRLLKPCLKAWWLMITSEPSITNLLDPTVCMPFANMFANWVCVSLWWVTYHFINQCIYQVRPCLFVKVACTHVYLDRYLHICIHTYILWSMFELPAPEQTAQKRLTSMTAAARITRRRYFWCISKGRLKRYACQDVPCLENISHLAQSAFIL